MMLNDGNLETAEKVLTEVYPYLKDEEKTQAEFLLGLTYMAKKDYKTAIFLFRHILSKDPHLTRVRLELARAYFENKDDYKANYHFRLALGAKDLPQEVQRNIFYFLYQLRERKRLYFYLNLGVSPETNINAVSGTQIECLNIFGLQACRELPGKESGLGLNGYAAVQYFLPLSKNLRFKNEAGFVFSDYRGSDFDTRQIYANFGPMYILPKGQTGVYFGGSNMWYAKEDYMFSWGPEAFFERDISNKLRMFLGYSYKQNEYKYTDLDYMNGHTNSGYVKFNYYLSSSTYFSLNNTLAVEKTERDFADNSRYSLGLGAGTDLPLGISVYLEPSVTWMNYMGERLFINDEGFLDMAAERSVLYSLSVRLLNRNISVYGFTPTVGVTLNKKTSNITNRDYEQARFNLGITRAF